MKKNNSSDSLDHLMAKLTKKLSKITRSRAEFIECVAKFPLVSMQLCEDLSETSDLLISIIKAIDNEKGELSAQKIDYLRRCLNEDI